MKFNVKTGKSFRGNTSISIHTYWLLQLTILKCLVFVIPYRKNKRMIHKILLIFKIKLICVYSSSRSHSREHMENSLTKWRYKLFLRCQREADPTMVSLKLRSKNPPTLSYDHQVLELLHAASSSPLFALEKSQPHCTACFSLCFVMHLQACLRDTATFGVFSLWFFLHFVQATSRVILSYMGRSKIPQKKPTELPRSRSDVEEQGPGHPCWKGCYSWWSLRTVMNLHSKPRVHKHSSVFRAIPQPFQQNGNLILSTLAQFTKGTSNPAFQKLLSSLQWSEIHSKTKIYYLENILLNNFPQVREDECRQTLSFYSLLDTKAEAQTFPIAFSGFSSCTSCVLLHRLAEMLLIQVASKNKCMLEF